MKITQDTGNAQYLIRGYEAGMVLINEQRFESSLVVTPTQLYPDWAPERFEELELGHLEELLALEPELVLLGTGERQRFPEQGLMRAVLRQGIGLEVMATEAACRTYNILMAEDRRVVAALMLR
ncbi:Mth938-like domain-containing protein [Alkalilimnicola sp. S0819]|uniref:Mth938-like domain-containing protein n=1 Tax=Alkalilimnicola sp. S0819 TaxID=2613922 RepID=UPI0012618925|nr:MTH938/NDUFAF3 family protein [Alkalilimnicola sp. S0819]KAB7622658.1 hypothetical protein F3N43_12370 [Alkalilimnicola sp. S0819]MPQ17429.1 hypothetical protein [Alkalilimnicola sp. S0819]